MPQPIILGDNSGLSQGISTLGSAIGSVLQKRAEAQQQKKYGDILNTVLSNLREKASPTDLIRAYSEVASQTSPEFAKGTLDILKPIIHEKVKGAEQRSVLEQLGLSPEGLLGPAINQQPFTGQPVESPQQVPPAPITDVVNPSSISNWSTDKLIRAKASGIKPLQDAADAVLKQREIEENRAFQREKIEKGTQLKREGFERKISDKATEENNKLAEKVKSQEEALDLANRALKEGVGPFSWANIANRLGIEEINSPAGAMMALASKYNILGNIKDVSARAQNLWIEQQISDAFLKVGRSDYANMAVIEYLRQSKDINKLQVDTFNKLAREDRKKYGYVREDINDRVTKKMKNKTKDILQRTVYNINKIMEDNYGYDYVIKNAYNPPPNTVPTPKTIAFFKKRFTKPDGKVDEIAAIEEMKRLGYVLQPIKDQ